MKFKLTMKDPDGVWDSVAEAVGEDEENYKTNHMIDVLNEAGILEYGEYLTIEIDSVTMEATIVRCK